jgi:hypothetical protein
VPSSPEFGNASGNIGIIEIFGEFEPNHSANAYGHIGVARKIKVDLKGISQDPDPGGISPQTRIVHGEDGIGLQSHLIGNQNLLCQSNAKPVETHQLIIRGVVLASVGDLISQIVVANDGAGNQLRKEYDIGLPLSGTSTSPGENQ